MSPAKVAEAADDESVEAERAHAREPEEAESMAKKSGSSGQRGKKKHQKELKRKSKLARPPAARPVRVPDWKPEKEGIEGLSRRLRRSFAAIAYDLTRFTSTALADLAGVVWTKPRIVALATNEILARLGALGIAATEADFLAGTEAESSAVRFAERAWLPLMHRGSSVHARDFVRLAAWSLWERLRPEAPPMEEILELCLIGDDHAVAEEPELALRSWLAFFDRLRPRLTPSIRTLADLDTLFHGGLDDVETWTQALYVFALESAARTPELTRGAAVVLGDLTERLSGEPDEWRVLMVDDQARLLAAVGAKSEGEQALRAMIARVAPTPNAWLTLVEFLTDDEDDDPDDLRGAIAALKAAKALEPDPEDHWDFDERLADLRDRLEAQGEDADSA